MASPKQGLVPTFQQKPLLRVHLLSLGCGDAKEGVVEQLSAAQKAGV